MFIIPIEGKNPTKHDHIAVWFVILICCVVYACTVVIESGMVFRFYAYNPISPDVFTLFTSMFLHAGLLHLLGNMFFLWMFGDNIEDVLGHYLFLFVYFLCGVAATLAFTLLHPATNTYLVGASGAISGIMGMYMVLFPNVPAKLPFFAFRREVKSLKTTILIAIGSWFALQAVLMFFLEIREVEPRIRIAFSAHVAGFLTGVLFGLIFVRLGFMKNYRSRRKKHWFFGYGKRVRRR